MKKDGYKFIAHTADIEFVAYGGSFESMLSNAILALFDTIADIKKLSKSKAKMHLFSIKETTGSMDELLWYTLQDALSITDAAGKFGYAVKSIKIIQKQGKYTINCSIACKDMDQKLAKLGVKGVSRFDLKVNTTKTGYGASVVLDV